MSVPVHDWQFWVVTLAAAGAMCWLARGILPGARKRRRRGQRAVLTLHGKAVR